MASVIASVIGGTPKRIDAETLGEAKCVMNAEKHTATVNGEPESDDAFELADEDYVSLAPAVKGGR